MWVGSRSREALCYYFGEKCHLLLTLFDLLVLRAQTELRVVLRICFRPGRGKGGPGLIFENLTWISSDFDLWKFRNHKNFNLTVLETQKELRAEIWSCIARAGGALNSKLGFNKSYVEFSILVFWTCLNWWKTNWNLMMLCTIWQQSLDISLYR